MRILLAVPDRDLLETFREILAQDLGETVTAFDGTQVLSLIAGEHFDAAVFDSGIPRIGYRELVARIREKKIPTVVLSEKASGALRTAEEIQADAYLSYPFSADTLKSVIRSVSARERE